MGEDAGQGEDAVAGEVDVIAGVLEGREQQRPYVGFIVDDRIRLTRAGVFIAVPCRGRCLPLAPLAA